MDFGKSGTTFEQRPEFRHLRDNIEKKPSFKVVIAYEKSRWGRAIDAEENTFWRVYFRRHGVDVILVKTAIDPKHEFSPMLKAFESVQASQYSKKLSELTLRGSMNNGRFSNGGPAPYGYNRAALNLKTGTMRVLKDGEWCTAGQEKVFWVVGENDEVETVKEIFELRIRGMSCPLIAEVLNLRGVSCPKRGRWKNKDQKWSSITIKSILENPVYRGARAYNRNSMSKIRADLKGWEPRLDVTYPHWKQNESEWNVVEEAHESLVSKAIWEAANITHKPQKKGVRKMHHTPFLLSGLIVCAKCGFNFQGQTAQVKGKAYARYICGGYNSKRVCTWILLKRDPIEKFVLDSVKDTLQNHVMLSKIEARLHTLLNHLPKKEKAEKDKLNAKKVVVENRLNKIMEAIEDGAPYNIWQERIATIEKERNEIQKAIDEQNRFELRSFEIKDSAKMVEGFCKRFEEIFESATLPERKDLLRRCVSRIVVEHEPKIVRCYVRKLPLFNNRIAGLFDEGLKMQMATQKSPLRISRVAGAGHLLIEQYDYLYEMIY